MSLADSLLADLDGLSDDGGPSEPETSAKGAMLPPPLPTKAVKRTAAEEMEGEASTVGFVPEGGVRPADELDQEEVEKTDMTGVEDVGKVARLMSGRKLKEVLSVSDGTSSLYNALRLMLVIGHQEIHCDAKRYVLDVWAAGGEPRVQPGGDREQYERGGGQRDPPRPQIHPGSLRAALPRT